MVRAVLDANVYVSAVIQPVGPPGQILERFLGEGAFTIILSPSIIAEVVRALAYLKVRKHIRGDIPAEFWFEDLVVLADLVPDRRPPGVASDPEDDKYIAAAMEGRAGYVVSGDRHLLDVKEHEGILMVTPGKFLAVVGR